MRRNDSVKVLVGLAGLTLIFWALPACSDDDSGHQAICGNGILELGETCDDGAQNSLAPNACRTDCTKPRCGDGIIDDLYGETCDDGNTADGDGCSASCIPEGTAQCGNGVKEAGEDCDDGNTNDGDGCSSDCHSEYCGDGVLQPNQGEECDDGTANSNSMPDACRTDCTSPRCGDGVVDSNEDCDDGNTDGGDGCGADCTFEAGVCGNGVVDEGEECDDGNTQSGDGCSSNCHLEPGICGNGVLEAGEQCDDGNTQSGDGCSSDCQLEGPVCGNGVVDGTEECDDGSDNSDTTPDACRTNCTLPGCGDSVVDSGETCDDGNTNDGDGCDHNCKTETAPGCGDGVVDVGEECDDGNTTACDGCSPTCQNEGCGNGRVECTEECDDGNGTDGDGCSSTCTIETVTTCQPAAELTCGDTQSWNTTGEGSTNLVDSYSCAPWNETGPEYAYVFHATTNSAITVTLTGLNSDLDLFLIADQNGQCDTTSCVASGETSVTFQSEQGQTYYLVVDGKNGASGPFSISLQCGVCGDGAVDPGEECDDGNRTDGDGCSSSCVLEHCGNGTRDAGEECDDGNNVDCDGCSATCTLETCGNGLRECNEECDDGNNTDGDGCSSNCTIESNTCTEAWDLTCGESDRWNTTYFGSTDDLDLYSCSLWSETGPEYIYSFTAPQTGQVTAKISDLDTGVDLDVFVMEGSCDPANCIAYGTQQAVFDAEEGTTYYISVDGYHDAAGNFTLSLGCAGGTCGDGVVNDGEECDDGNNVACDGCSATCTQETCGNGIVECDEECDDGNNAGGDGCSPDCRNESRSCVPEWGLRCGANDSWSTTSSTATDNVDAYSCNSYDESGPEYTYWYYAYEDGDVTVTISYDDNQIDLDLFVLEETGGGCGSEACIQYGDTSATFTAQAGHYYYFVVDGFMGDQGSFDISVSCAGGNPSCGNGSLEPGEQCDDGNGSSNDGCSGSCTLEDGTCSGDKTLSCGDTDNWSTTGLANKVSKYGCSSLTESGPEYTYQFVADRTGSVTVDVSPVDPNDDMDVFVLLKQGNACTPGNCIARGITGGGEHFTFQALAGQTYFIVVDGFANSEGDFSISVTCN